MGSIRFCRAGAALVLALLTLAAGFGPLATPARAGNPADGQKTILSTAPDFTATGVDGKVYHLRELLQKGPVLLDFWSTWCKPCMLELPKLQAVWERHRGAGFTLLGVPSDDQKTAAKVKPMIQSKGFAFPNVPDPTRKIGNLYNVRNYPTTVLIAPDGKIVKVVQGFTPGDEKEWEARITAILLPTATPATESK
jgi:peroxiredoxin